MSVNTTVITAAPNDYGVGESDRIIIADVKYVVDDEGYLHLHRQSGNVATFPVGTWRAVVTGSVVSEAGLTAVKR